MTARSTAPSARTGAPGTDPADAGPDPATSSAATGSDAVADVDGSVGDNPLPSGERGRPRALTTIGVITFVLYVIASIGSPLWGGSVLAATDELSIHSPYFESGMGGLVVQNTYMDDTYDGVMPDTFLFADELRQGDFAAWNPYSMGGVALGATPSFAVLNPLTVPYYLLPEALAPGYVKLLETVFAGAMTFLFLRRLRLSRPAALLGGLLFASSAFLVVWTNWPHTRTAAFIPAVFWALERLVQHRRARDAALVALAVGGMLAGGFPAVTAFTLYTAGPYLLVRTLAEYGGQWRRLAGVLAAAAAGVAAGAALLAVQLLPFVSFMRTALIAGRDQVPSQRLDPASLVTALAPFALGSVNRAEPPHWWLPVNLVESMMYVGAAGIVLLVVAVATPWSARAFLPRGVWSFLVATLGGWLMVLYLKPAVALAQHLPVFSSNFVGRARSVVGLLIAALAAVGLEVLLRRVRARAAASQAASERPGRLRAAYPVVVWAVFGVAGLLVLWDARGEALRFEGSPGARRFRVDHLYQEVAVGGLFLLLTLLAVAVLWWRAGTPGDTWRRLRFAAAAGLPVLAAAQALTFVGPYWPRVDRSTFFPVTQTHSYLMENLGHDRFVGTPGAMSVGTDAKLRLRALYGHEFTNRRWSETVNALPGPQFTWPTMLILQPTEEIATSPVLDRLAVRYLVANARTAPVIGDRREPDAGGEPVTLRAGQSVTVPLRPDGPPRAVVLAPVGPVPKVGVDAAVEVVLRDAAGAELARSRRLLTGIRQGKPLDVPIAAQDVPGSRVRAVEIRTTGAPELTVAGTSAGGPAVGFVTAPDDGLRLVEAWPAVIYERTDTLPRVRWASSAVVEPDPSRTLRRLAEGTVADDTVILESPGPDAAGQPATVTITEDGTDQIEARVSADGAGYLVVADAIQSQWRVTVDGQPAQLRPADHGLAAVAVPAGEHDVRFSYAAPYGNAGLWISLITALALTTIIATGPIRDKRRRRGGLSSPAPRATRLDGDANAGS